MSIQTEDKQRMQAKLTGQGWFWGSLLYLVHSERTL